MPAKNEFYFDLYFNGKFIRRFNSSFTAGNFILESKIKEKNVDFWEIKKVRKRKLSTKEK